MFFKNITRGVVLMLLLNSVDVMAQTNSASKTLFFPQIADGVGAGGAWQTTFTIAHRANERGASATVKFYDDNGSPMTVSVGGQQVTQVAVPIAPYGLAQFKTDGVGALKTGWATLQADDSTLGLALYTFSTDSGAFVDEVGSPATVATTSPSVFTQLGASISTGVAIANPNSASASITLVLKDQAANEVARTAVQIPAMGHLSRYVPELFPNLGLAALNGKMDVIASQPVAAMTLRQRESVFTSFPQIEAPINASLLALGWQVVPGSNKRFTPALGHGVVNSAGDVAFVANMSDGAGNDFGLFEVSKAKLTSLVLPDQPVPGRSGMVFRQAGPGAINNAGDVAFIGNFAPPGISVYESGAFVASGGNIQKIADSQTLLPGSSNQYLCCYAHPQINDRGDVSFDARIITDLQTQAPVGFGVFLMSQNVLSSIAIFSNANTNPVTTAMLGSMNNNGDLVYSANGSLFLYSNGSTQTIATAGQTIPNTTTTVNAYTSSIDDLQDVVFTNATYTFCNFCSQIAVYAIARWTAGNLTKVVAGGDPIPLLPGERLVNFDLNTVCISPTGVLVSGDALPNGVNNGFADTFLAEVQNGTWTTVPRDVEPSGEIVPGIASADLVKVNCDAKKPIVGLNGVGEPFDVPELYLQQSSSPYSLSFPQIADGTGAGGGWRTSFYLANSSNSQMNATVSFYDDSGAPMSISLGGQQMTQVTVTLPPLGTTEIQTDGTGNLRTGWATVQSDQRVSGLALFTFMDGAGNFMDEVGAPATIGLRSSSTFAQSGSAISTGVAIANPNANPVDVTVILQDLNLQEIARTTITLPPMAHLARYINELFPNVPLDTFDGKIQLTSASPLASLTLRQHNTVFTTYPVIP